MTSNNKGRFWEFGKDDNGTLFCRVDEVGNGKLLSEQMFITGQIVDVASRIPVGTSVQGAAMDGALVVVEVITSDDVVASPREAQAFATHLGFTYQPKLEVV